ncbi:MAG: pilus assembly protein [Candidatus Omnitrophica bacterium]|nr:pilus assembly protein [Candidatus Omnitrophota bacterium]
MTVNAAKKKKNKLFTKSGVEVVEFAIVFPLFAIMALGSVEVGWLLYQQSVLDYATRQGARYASVDTASALKAGISSDVSAQAEAVIINTVTGFGGTAPTNIYLKMPWPNGRTFALVAEETYTPVMGKLIPAISNISMIKSTVTMYCEACG